MELKAISRRLRVCAVVCLAAFCLAASEHHGIVKFGTIPVPGATVTAMKDDKKVVAVTDESGAYSFPDLEDGIWKLQVEMLTFTTATKEIGVAAGAPGAEWDLKMQSMDEIKPSLQAAPPPGAAPAPSATAPAGAAPSATTAPAATAAAPPPAPTKGKKGAAASTPQAGFQRTDVNASGDAAAPSGAASNTPPSIAEAQSSSDAFVVNGSTSNGIERRAIGNGRKGPRSLFNGGIDFRNFEDDITDARNYSYTGQNTARSPRIIYTAGGFLQGPLWVPHVFHWQGNFSMQYQTTRTRTSSSNSSLVMPTEQEREGNFSQVLNAAGAPVVITDPNTGQPIPNGIIPANEISPQAKYFLNYYPLPQFAAPAGQINFQVSPISRLVQDQFSARANKPINNKNSLNFLFAMQDSSNDSENALSWLDTTKVNAYHGNVAYNHNFSRTLYGRFTVDYTRYAVRTTPFFANKTNVSGDAGIAGNDQTPGNWGPPALSFTGSSPSIYGLSDANENFVRNQTPQFGGQITYIRRPHNFQIGGDFKAQDLSTVGQSNGRGGFGFTGAATGYDFADFLFGIPDTSSINLGNADKYLHSNIYDLYINDNWNVSSSFTLQWGVRWDYQSPFTEEYGRLANLDIAPGYTSALPVTAVDPVGSLTGMHYPNSLVQPDKHQISPRVSIAWRPIFGSSMVVRGGYGLYYNTSIYQGIATAMDQQAPFSKSLSVQNSPTDPLTLANGFNQPAGATADTWAIDPNLRVGYFSIYNASVQQNISASWLLTATYTGTKGTRTLQEFQPNTYAPGGEPPCATCLPGYTYLASNGNSTRNAGQIQLRRRFHSGIATTFAYTYAKAIDDSGSLLSYGGSAANGGPGPLIGTVAQNWMDLAGERGPSNTDQRHLFTTTLQYSTGVGVHGGALLSGWRGQILKGWTFLTTVTVGSGLPFTPLYYDTLQGSTQNVIRPEYVGGNVYGGAGGLFLNPLAFAAPPAGQFGNVGRNALYGPNQFSMIGSMARSFQDKYTLTVAATNVPNHPVYSGVYSTYNQNASNYGAFGQLSPPGAMRTITATFRWTF